MLPRAILFDLDDTILSAGRRPAVLAAIAEEFLAELAPHPPQAVADRLEAALALFWSDPVRHKQARFGLPAARRQVMAETFAALSPVLDDGLAHRFADRFTDVREAMTDFYPGAREAIVALKDRGVRLALVTNGDGPTQRAKVERFDLAPLFDHIQIEGEHGFGKPEERAYRHALSALDAEAGDAWMVGDNLEWEVAAPQRLGLFAIWHDPFGAGLPADSDIRPDRIIRALGELLE